MIMMRDNRKEMQNTHKKRKRENSKLLNNMSSKDRQRKNMSLK